MKTILLRISLAGIVAAPAFYTQNPSAATQAPVRYNVTDLGTFGGNFSTAFWLNNAGAVGGSAARPDGNTDGFFLGAGGRGVGAGEIRS